VRRFVSKNVVGRLPGAKRPDEHVLFLAHWDHLGRCAPGKPDPICNGAVDNASGVGGLIELARAFTSGKRPDRSILFLATTAEEGGLMGARHYVEQPVVPLAQTVGGLGADTIASGEAPADIVVLGQGLSPDMDRIIAAAARSQGRRMVVDKAGEEFFQRSDHYPFAAAGVPVLIATSVFAPAARPATERYFADRYHKPADEYRPGLPLAGAAADIDLAYRVGLRLANGRDWPRWKAGTPYAAARAKQR
jgi:Zn-dependent M28 family amino/carboxypeptidase